MKRTLDKLGRSILLVTAGACLAATSSSQAQQFDLICNLRGRTIPEMHPELEGFAAYNGPAQWHDTVRIPVDLNKMAYCHYGSCAKISRVTVDYIIFDENEEWVRSFDRKRRVYREHEILGAFRAGLTTGQCRYAAFSSIIEQAASTQP